MKGIQKEEFLPLTPCLNSNYKYFFEIELNFFKIKAGPKQNGRRNTTALIGCFDFGAARRNFSRQAAGLEPPL